MKSIVLLTALLAVVFNAPAFAQSPASPSLLGKRTIETDLGINDYTQYPTDYFVGTTVNVPLTAGLDAGASFDHTRQEGGASHYEVLGAHLTGYRDVGATRLFARATLNYEWWAVENLVWYQADIGAERALCSRVLLSAFVSWHDFFSSQVLDGSFSSTAKLTYWVTPKVALDGSGSLLEEGSISYRVGVTFVF